jgi:hypothetical protein
MWTGSSTIVEGSSPVMDITKQAKARLLKDLVQHMVRAEYRALNPNRIEV